MFTFGFCRLARFLVVKKEAGRFYTGNASTKACRCVSDGASDLETIVNSETPLGGLERKTLKRS